MLTPPKPGLPPLKALRAFESAARLGGFKAAAVELSVTPGAVAQHIKSLESWVGAPLFERLSQGVRLTALGAEVSADFSNAFDRLGSAVNRLRADAAPDQIRIAVLPSIAQLWLSPRLPQIRALVPQKTISITALDYPPNLLREPFDLSIFFVEGEANGHQIEICRDVIFPVCAPAMASRLKSPADLAGETFLHDARWARHWSLWLAAAQADIDPVGPTFSLYSLALQEAENGAGLLMGHEPLVRGRIEAGSLVAPFEQKVELPRVLAIETPMRLREGSSLRQIVAALCRSW